jgi:ubiquinone/menaquinone biosynthesis C-methylase UbiE
MSLSVKQSLKDNYDTYYNGETEWRRLGAVDKVNNIISLCEVYSPQNILEIGSGDGSILQCLSEQKFGENLYSLEISKSGVETILGREIDRLKECKLFDGYTLPYNDRQFDLVILSHVVEHLEFPRKLLYEAARVGKYVFVEVPCEDNFRLSHDFVYDKTGHINFYSPKTIRRFLQSTGLKILSQTLTNPSYPIYELSYKKKAILHYLPKELLLLSIPKLAPYIWTYHCSLICQKK